MILLASEGYMIYEAMQALQRKHIGWVHQVQVPALQYRVGWIPADRAGGFGHEIAKLIFEFKGQFFRGAGLAQLAGLVRFAGVKSSRGGMRGTMS